MPKTKRVPHLVRFRILDIIVQSLPIDEDVGTIRIPLSMTRHVPISVLWIIAVIDIEVDCVRISDL